MSEIIYTWLLRLYPFGFREAYGDEALQLFRDRARDETGVIARLRLWFDLLSDLVISLPGSYRASRAAAAASTAGPASGSQSYFHLLILEDESLRLGSVFYGGIAPLVVYCGLLFLFGYGVSSFSMPVHSNQPAIHIQRTGPSNRLPPKR